MDTPDRDNGHTRLAESTTQEAHGASQIGPFDYCPKQGFREYWYPAIEARHVRGKPVHLTMLGDDLVLFRDKAGRVAALSDWCPHRGARLSLGVCEFDGTVTCPYHGYTFDGTGQCVAALIERPDSPFMGKLRARAYPTEERMGIVFVWMGVFKRERLNLERPQKLGPLDVALIYFRRHLAQRARDYQRLGQASGAIKSPGRTTLEAPQLGDAPQPVAAMAAGEPRA